MDCIVEEALSNSTILRAIFSFLKDEDLERCCHVSQFWRAVADFRLFSHFLIQLGKTECLPMASGNEMELESDNIVIRERDRYNRKKFTPIDVLNFSDLTKVLTKALLTHKVSINLTVHAKTDDQKKLMDNFLSNFGPLVVKMDFDYPVWLTVMEFSKFLLNNLPKLRELSFADLKLAEDSPENGKFDPDLPHNKHKHLRKISFERFASWTVQACKPILKMASNLKEIQHLPIKFVNVFDLAGKGQLLKSLEFSDYPFANDVSYFQNLARLQPKLTSFHLLKIPSTEKNCNAFEMIKPLIFSILESSSETLQTLRLPRSGLRGYESLPRIEALEKLEFADEWSHDGLIFPANISLTEIFPNLREFHISYSELNYIMNPLPENSIIPWNAPIKILSLRGEPSLNNLLKLQKLFPSIEEFHFLGSSNGVAEVLPAMPLWTNLKSLTIEICTARNHEDSGPLKLDFTGLSEKRSSLYQLGNTSRRRIFPDVEIQDFKDESPTSKCKDLTVLRLTFEKACDAFGLSASANEFGFKLLPHLKVTLEIYRIYEYAKEETERVLELLAQSETESDLDFLRSKMRVVEAKEPFD